MPAFGEGNYFPPLSLLSVTGDGNYTVSITLSAPHNLVTNNQITVDASSSANANGTYSVTVVSAVALTYLTNKTVPSGSLLTGTTLVYPVNIGLPYNYAQLPQTGI